MHQCHRLVALALPSPAQHQPVLALTSKLCCASAVQTCAAPITVLVVGILWKQFREEMKNRQLLINAVLLPAHSHQHANAPSTIASHTEH